MYHNLTDKQLKALRWLVKQVENGEVEESFTSKLASTVHIAPQNSSKLLIDRKRVPEYLDFGVLDALTASEVLVSNPSKHRYTLTRKAYEIAAFDFGNPEPDPVRMFILTTYNLMSSAFNREELSQLCFELHVNPDWIFGDSRDWPFELLLYLYRQNRLDELPSLLQEQRPKNDWPTFPNDPGRYVTN